MGRTAIRLSSTDAAALIKAGSQHHGEFATEYGHRSIVHVLPDGRCILEGRTPSHHTGEYMDAMFSSLETYSAWQREVWYVDREASERQRSAIGSARPKWTWT